MKQESRCSEEQLDILKGAIAENELVISAIRKIFLENELTENEEKALDLAVRKKPAVQEVLRRHYCPKLVVDAPVGQVQDRLATIPVADLAPEIAILQAEGVERAEECLEAHLEEMFTGKPGVSYKTLYNREEEDFYSRYIGLFARHKYIVDAERLTHHLQLLAGQKSETPEQTMERLRKNSAK